MDIGRNSLKVYLSLRRLSFGEYFFFFGGADGIYLCISLWLEGMGSSCPRYFPSSPGDFGGSFNISYHFNYCSANPGFDASSGVWHEIHSPRPLSQKMIFLFPISADGRRGLFPLWDSSQSFGFYLLPSPVRRFVWATIYPCTPLFTHPVTKYKHLLVSILTWICYLRNWPKFLFQGSVLGLLIQIRRNSSNPPLLLSQWETTWHYAHNINSWLVWFLF